jgi:hypothetical protein
MFRQLANSLLTSTVLPSRFRFEMRSVGKFAAYLVLQTIATSSAVAQVMPSDLIGNYTHSGTEQCESFRIEPRSLFGEGMGCEVLSVKRLHGEPGSASSFAISLSCQMDDPQKPKLAGILTLDNIFDRWFLGVRLDVEPKLRRKLSYPHFKFLANAKRAE